jgi:flagellar hook-associated protein 3 FlgL
VRTTFISSHTIWNTPRSNILRMQTELAQLSQEVVTGRMSDVGRELGAGSASATSLHIDVTAFEAAITSNALTATRLKQSELSFVQLREDAIALLQQLINTRGTNTPVASLASSGLSAFIDGVNVSDGRSYLLSGINSTSRPLSAYADAPKTAVDAAFLAKFSIGQGDPSIDQIGSADMLAFLDTEFAALFDDPNWGTAWSSASDQAIRSRISPTEALDTSVSANEPAMRKLAMVYTMVSELGVDGLADETRGALIEKAIGILGDAISDLTALEVDVGVKRSRVEDATERLRVQKTMLETRVGQLEGVDPAEAKVRIDSLTVQLEMSYSLTARLLQLSILNYV